ncbi:MAG: PEGA domain-containing protein [bacterium]
MEFHPLQDEPGYLILETRYSGLEVRIDGKFIGYTPVDVVVLSTGLHQVTVSYPNPANWMDEDWLANVKIMSSDTLRVPVVFKKSYSINSNPYGATVWLEKNIIGETPIFFKLYENEVKQITLTKAGYQDTSFTIGTTKQLFFDISLRKRKNPLDQSLGVVGSDLKKSSKSKKYLYSAVGLTVVSGALALFFRKKGNAKYDLYLSTGNPEVTDKYFNEAKKFDRLSAVSFGVFQVSFIASFYLFLKRVNQ